MGILSRASYVIRSKLNSPQSDRGPDGPLDYSYEQMRDELQDVKTGDRRSHDPEEATGDSKRKLDENVEKHNRQAREAVQQDRDDLARKALEEEIEDDADRGASKDRSRS